jgi:hypothetical protein
MSRSRFALPVVALTGILVGPALGATSLNVPVAAPTPVKLAIFDFELEDISAAMSEIASDATELANATGAIRQLLARSGRYQVVATGDAVKKGNLHDCDGCDAAIEAGRRSIPGWRHPADQSDRIYVQVSASRCPYRRSHLGRRKRASNGRQLFVE